MSTKQSYGMICPITKAAEILEPRWTLPILCELWNGYTRFNDLKRVVGNISPGVLSKRLAEMEMSGLVERIGDPARGTVDYVRTQKAIDLEPAMHALAHWAQRNIEAEVAVCAYNVSQLMWKLRAVIKTDEFPKRRVVIRFSFTDEDGPYPRYWMLCEPGKDVEMCVSVPAFDIDIYVETTKASLAAIVLGRSTFARETGLDRFFVTGDAVLARSIERWLPVSEYASLDGIQILPAAE